MSVTQKIPSTSIFRPVVVSASATPAAGFFNFSTVNNQNLSVQGLNPGSVYLIDSVNFRANAVEVDYIQGQDTVGAIVPAFQLSYAGSGQAVPTVGQPYPLVTYLTAQDFGAFVWTQAQADSLLLTATGNVGVSAGLVAFATLKLWIGLNIWEIRDQKWVDEFLGAGRPVKKVDITDTVRERV